MAVDLDGEWIVLHVRRRCVAVDLRHVLPVGWKEIKFNFNGSGCLVRNSAEVPVVTVSVLARCSDKLSDAGINYLGNLPVGGNIFNKLERRLVLIVFRQI